MPRLLAALALAAVGPASLALAAEPGSPGSVSGELKQWHKVTLTVDGPFAREARHPAQPLRRLPPHRPVHARVGRPELRRAGLLRGRRPRGETSATEGTKWRAHFSPDKAGRWTWRAVVPLGQPPPSIRRRTVEAGRRRGSMAERGPSRSCPPTRGPRFPRARAPAVRGPALPAIRRHRRVFPQGRTGRAGDAARATPISTARSTGKPKRPSQDLGAPRARLAARRPDLEGRQGQGTHRRPQLPGGPGGSTPSPSSPTTPAATATTSGRSSTRDDEAPLRLLEARPVADRLRPRAVARPLPALQAAGDRDRRQRRASSTRSRRGEARDAPMASLDGGEHGRRAASCTTGSSWPASATSSRSTGTSARRTARRPSEQRAMAQGHLGSSTPTDHLVVIHTYPDEQDRVYTPLLGQPDPRSPAPRCRTPLGRAHQRVAEVAARVGAGRASLGRGERRAGRRRPRACRPTPASRASPAGRRRRRASEYDLHDIRELHAVGHAMAGGAGVEYYFGY